MQRVLRMVRGPVVRPADRFADDGDTTEIARPPLPAPAPPRLPGSARGPLALIAAVTVLPAYVVAARVGDTVFVAPVLSDLAGGFALLLLPVMWAAYLMLSALPATLVLAAVAAVTLSRAGGPGLGPRAVLRATLHRLRPRWTTLAGIGVVGQVLPLSTAGQWASPLAVAALATAGAALAALLGVAGCVTLFERGRGMRRARELMSRVPGRALAALLAASAALTVLPWVVSATAGPVIVVWALTALSAYVQARRVDGPIDAGALAYAMTRA